MGHGWRSRGDWGMDLLDAPLPQNHIDEATGEGHDCVGFMIAWIHCCSTVYISQLVGKLGALLRKHDLPHLPRKLPLLPRHSRSCAPPSLSEVLMAERFLSLWETAYWTGIQEKEGRETERDKTFVPLDTVMGPCSGVWRDLFRKHTFDRFLTQPFDPDRNRGVFLEPPRINPPGPQGERR